jgi:hypothetical protein
MAGYGGNGKNSKCFSLEFTRCFNCYIEIKVLIARLKLKF